MEYIKILEITISVIMCLLLTFDFYKSKTQLNYVRNISLCVLIMTITLLIQ